MKTRRPHTSSAFTRIDTVAVGLALLAITAVAMTPREAAQRAACHNNLRQLGVAAMHYADEHEGLLPPRRSPRWPAELRPYYPGLQILLCPADGPTPFTFGFPMTNADAAPRSYLMNGWNDWLLARHGSPFATNALPVSAIAEPGQTIAFGEKPTESGHAWFDLMEGVGNDLWESEDARHFRRSATDGASNHLFADGSVRLLRYGESHFPINLWAILPEWRSNFIVP
jgi:hypothetical protein